MKNRFRQNVQKKIKETRNKSRVIIKKMKKRKRKSAIS